MGLTGFNLRRRRKASLLKSKKKAEKAETSTEKKEDVKETVVKTVRKHLNRLKRLKEKKTPDDLF